MRRSLLVLVLCLLQPLGAEEAKPAAPAPAWPADKPMFPATLPGDGLAQHDFFYAGEAKTQDMYIVRKGKVVWEYHSKAKGEISDAVLLSNGSILFAHQYGVTWIDAEKNVLWHHDAPPQTEIHTAQPIGTERVLFVQNGDPAKVVVINIKTGQTEVEFNLPVKNPKSTHGQFRHARLTPAGTLVVAQMDLGKVAEYDSAGRELWSTTPGIATWAATRIPNGNTLISGGKSVREVDAKGASVWTFTPADVPDYKFDSIQIATRLPSGNTLINTWENQWSGVVNPAKAPVQAIEVTPEKKVVWALRAWGDPVNLGPSTTLQLLDQSSKPEAVHFGKIK